MFTFNKPYSHETHFELVTLRVFVLSNPLFQLRQTSAVSLFVCVSGLSLESETGLSPVETDSDSHRPLMSDEEEEVCDRHYNSVQQPDEPLGESPKAISFLQAFRLPGVLPVSPQLDMSIQIHDHNIYII